MHVLLLLYMCFCVLAAQPFTEGIPIADALAAADAAEDAAALRRTPSRASRRGRAARSVVDVEAEDPDAALPAFVYPRPDAPDAITLVRGDRGRLDDGEFLNDNLINLYLRHRTTSAEAPPLDAHVFSTFFFTSLQNPLAKNVLESSAKPPLLPYLGPWS